jgi:hypothetical protein
MKKISIFIMLIATSCLTTFYYLEHSIIYLAEIGDSSYKVENNINGCKFSTAKYSKSLDYSAIWSDTKIIKYRELD